MLIKLCRTHESRSLQPLSKGTAKSPVSCLHWLNKKRGPNLEHSRIVRNLAVTLAGQARKVVDEYDMILQRKLKTALVPVDNSASSSAARLTADKAKEVHQ